MAKKNNPLEDLEKRLAAMEHHVSAGVRKALKAAEKDLRREERKLARAVQAAEKRVLAEEQKWVKKAQAAVKSAEASMARGGRDVEQLARKGTYATVDALRPPRRKGGAGAKGGMGARGPRGAETRGKKPAKGQARKARAKRGA